MSFWSRRRTGRPLDADNADEELKALEARLDERPAHNLELLRPWIARATEGLGPDHEATLRARCKEALWTYHGGDPWTARGLADALVPALLRVLGPYDELTLAFRGARAAWTGFLGDADTARQLCADVLPDLYADGTDSELTTNLEAHLADWSGGTTDPGELRGPCSPSG